MHSHILCTHIHTNACTFTHTHAHTHMNTHMHSHLLRAHMHITWTVTAEKRNLRTPSFGVSPTSSSDNMSMRCASSHLAGKYTSLLPWQPTWCWRLLRKWMWVLNWSPIQLNDWGICVLKQCTHAYTHMHTVCTHIHARTQIYTHTHAWVHTMDQPQYDIHVFLTYLSIAYTCTYFKVSY